MALVIVSGGGLASSRMRITTLRMLVVVAVALTIASLIGGFAVGFQLADARHADVVRSAEFADLDPAQPGSQALIHEIGSLSGRLVRLEAAADRLTRSVRATSPAIPSTAQTPAVVVDQPAGGPLVTPPISAESGPGSSLQRIERGLGFVEARLDRVASTIARRDLSNMSFPSRAPIPGVRISSGFGHRIDPFTRQLAQHAGIDYPAWYGTSIRASAGGQIRRAGPYGAYGRTVEIDHGAGLVTRYGHASRILVRVGDVVLPGQPIATVGSTGRSTGPHLHFEILRDGRQVHPDLYLAGDES